MRLRIPRWSQVRECLRSAGILWVSDGYCEGHCKKYRIQEPYCSQQLVEAVVLDPDLNDAINSLWCDFLAKKHPAIRTIQEMILRTTVDLDAYRDWSSARAIDENIDVAIRLFDFSKNRISIGPRNGRISTKIVLMKSAARAFVRADGEPESLWVVDLPNSQPTFLAIESIKRGCVDSGFVMACQHGWIYDLVCDWLNCSRRDAKKHLFNFLYGSTRPKEEPIRILKKNFKQQFPNTWRLIKKIKSGNYKRMALMLQQREREFVIGRVCGSLIQNHPAMWMTTIHDAIMCKRRDVGIVAQEIRKAFRELDYGDDDIPVIHVKDTAKAIRGKSQ